MKEMKVLMYVLIFVGILITSCDNNPVDPGSDVINITIISPSNQDKFLIEESVPCSVRVTPSVPEKEIWKANGQVVDCNDGHLSFSESGRYVISAEVISDRKMVQSNTVNVEVLPPITGRISPINSEGEIANLQGIEVMIGDSQESTLYKVSATGGFEIRTQIVKTSLDSFNICIRPSGNDFYDSCVKDVRIYNPWSPDDFIFNFVLVPKQWRVKSEVYNEVINIDLVAAFDLNGSPNRWDRFYRSNVYIPSRLDNRPVKVYLGHDESDTEITDKDSLFVWSAIEKMERYLGMGKIFTPAKAEDVVGNEGIKIVYNDSILPSSGKSYGGKVTLSYKGQKEESTIIHEMIHEMGIGHTCGWSTIMGGVDGDCPAVVSPEKLTPEDVGYIQLLYGVRDIQSELNAPYGILEAYETVK